MSGPTSFHWGHGGVKEEGMMVNGERVGAWRSYSYGESAPKKAALKTTCGRGDRRTVR
jgi:hypothetical protein